jgi:hypothetical protein
MRILGFVELIGDMSVGKLSVGEMAVGEVRFVESF